MIIRTFNIHGLYELNKMEDIKTMIVATIFDRRSYPHGKSLTWGEIDNLKAMYLDLGAHWQINLHRTNGPAIIGHNPISFQQYWLDGKQYEKDAYWDKLTEIEMEGEGNGLLSPHKWIRDYWKDKKGKEEFNLSYDYMPS